MSVTRKDSISCEGKQSSFEDSLIAPLYSDVPGFAVGCVCTFLACVVTAVEVGTIFVWSVCAGLGILTLLRVEALILYKGSFRTRFSTTAWRKFYWISGLAHVFLIGLWPLAVFSVPDDVISRLFSFGTAICFLVGLVARNFNYSLLVRFQVAVAAVPMTGALLYPLDLQHGAFAFFFAVFCAILLRISDNMRATFRRALQAAEENRQLALCDSLTGLPNRACITQSIAAEICNSSTSFAVHFIDLDRLKHLNDSYGHSFGDRALIEAAKRMSALDQENSTLARFAGDEFVLLQRKIKGPEDAASLASALLTNLHRPLEIDGIALNLSCSLGTAIYPQDGSSLEEIIQRADTALYAAKAVGRGRQVFFDAAMERREKERTALEAELRQALLADQLIMVFQPIVDTSTQRVRSCEALLRWRHPEKGMLSPGAFLPVAEECGLMNDITDRTLQMACRAASNWPNDVSVAVNISPSQLARQDILERIIDSARQENLPVGRLELEITENLFVDHDTAVLEKLHLLRTIGIGLSLDDFGTGYSNLDYISRLPIGKIKIDRTFIDRAEKCDGDRNLLSGMIRFIQSLGLRIVAEGVETDEQFALVTKLHPVEELQGFIFGRPMEDSDIQGLLAALDLSQVNSLRPIRNAVAEPFKRALSKAAGERQAG